MASVINVSQVYYPESDGKPMGETDLHRVVGEPDHRGARQEGTHCGALLLHPVQDLVPARPHRIEGEADPVFDARGLLGHEARLQADIRVTTLPEGLDPDEVVNRNPDEWRAIVENARPVVVHVMETLAAGRDLDDPKTKSAITQDARLVVLNARAARDLGARILTRTRCVGLRRERDHWRIDLVDNRADRMVWQGVAVAQVDDRVAQALRDAIYTATNRIFEQYPHRAGS